PGDGEAATARPAGPGARERGGAEPDAHRPEHDPGGHARDRERLDARRRRLPSLRVVGLRGEARHRAGRRRHLAARSWRRGGRRGRGGCAPRRDVGARRRGGGGARRGRHGRARCGRCGSTGRGEEVVVGHGHGSLRVAPTTTSIADAVPTAPTTRPGPAKPRPRVPSRIAWWRATIPSTRPTIAGKPAHSTRLAIETIIDASASPLFRGGGVYGAPYAGGEAPYAGCGGYPGAPYPCGVP